MTQKELTVLNVGQSLDDLMNLDPRGYGVCKILYKASRAYAGMPTSMNAAMLMDKSITRGSLVYVFTGFVLLQHQKSETDGICGALQLCRAIVQAFEAVPVLIVPQDSVKAAKAMAYVMGLHTYDSVEEARDLPFAMAIETFTKDVAAAPVRAAEIMAKGLPSMAIATECAGANTKGEYHNAAGAGITVLEAKSDYLWNALREKGVPTLAVGDLGNEMGMATLSEHIIRYIPRAAEGTCVCGCKGGLLAASSADAVVTATVSDWGIYAVLAALAYLKGDMEISPDENLVRENIVTAARNGMVDMTGRLTPGVDGFSADYNAMLAGVMHRTAAYPPTVAESTKRWFDETDALGFFHN